MKNQKPYIASLLNAGVREDGREFFDYRDLDVQINTLSQANGSARVRLGETEVIVGVKFNVGEPYPDSPSSGNLIVSAELPPLASKNFESGPPKPPEIEFARVIDRTVRESGAIDFKKLCIKDGEAVWMVFIDIYPVNDGGNLFDAAAIGAILALSNARLPKYDKKEGKVEHREHTKETLKLEKTPILCTFGKVGDKIIVDPNLEEEAALDALMHIATLENGDICAMQKSGVTPFTEKELKLIVTEAGKKGKDLRKLLKKY